MKLLQIYIFSFVLRTEIIPGRSTFKTSGIPGILILSGLGMLALIGSLRRHLQTPSNRLALEMAQIQNALPGHSTLAVLLVAHNLYLLTFFQKGMLSLSSHRINRFNSAQYPNSAGISSSSSK